MGINLRRSTCLLAAIVFMAGCSVTQRQNYSLEGSIEDLTCQHTEMALNCVNVVDVYDGDTIFIDIPEIVSPFGKRLGVRIAGIDTPERSSKDSCEKRKAMEAKAALEALIYNAERIDIVNPKRDKYFRILGDVRADGQSVAKELLGGKLAYPYHGEKKLKRNWCN